MKPRCELTRPNAALPKRTLVFPVHAFTRLVMFSTSSLICPRREPPSRTSLVATKSQLWRSGVRTSGNVRGAVLGRDGGVSPSERIILGGIGIGNRGRYVLSCFLPQPDVQFVAVCDVQQRRRESVKKMVDDQYGNRDCGMITDLRELLARPDIDAVLIATGPNWHALSTPRSRAECVSW